MVAGRAGTADGYNALMGATVRSRLSLLLWLACGIVFAVQTAHVIRANGSPIAGNDFPAFYCAGAALDQHASPYTLEPLRTCEHAIQHGSDLPARFVTPAPLPPYALDVFAILAALPYRIAAWLWFAFVAAACALLAATIARICNVPSGGVAAALLLPAALASATIGQLPPLAVCAIALCGAALASADDALAAILACAATIEPHLGLPAVLGLFFFRPRTRWWLASGALAAACISIATVGLPGIAYYFGSVLPAQAHAELLSADQFSLSHVLAIAHLSSSAALLAGTLSYVTTLAAGIAIAPYCARRLGEAALVYVPCASVLVGGAFVHEIQLVAALPAAYLLLIRAAGAQQWAGRIAVAAVAAVPFTLASEHHVLLDALAVACTFGALVSASTANAARVFPLWPSLAAAAFCVAVPLAAVRAAHVPVSPAPAAVAAMRANANASDNWGAYLRSDPRYAAFQAGAEFAKTPAWLGLISLLVASLSMGAMGTVRPRAIGYARTLQPVAVEDRVAL
jgi:hypothetical protein